MAKLTINLVTLAEDMMTYAFKRSHLDERYDFLMTKGAGIPAKVKESLKDYVNASYWSGKDGYFFVLRAKSPEEVRDEDAAKVTSMVKNGLYLSENTDFSSDDVYKCMIQKDGEKPTHVFFVVKVYLHV